jgi:hypothetical protein
VAGQTQGSFGGVASLKPAGEGAVKSDAPARIQNGHRNLAQEIVNEIELSAFIPFPNQAVTDQLVERIENAWFGIVQCIRQI